VHDFLVRMDRAAERLGKLVDQIVSMLLAQRFEQILEPKPTDLPAMLKQASDDVRPFIELRRQTLNVDVPEDLGTMNIDGPKIRDSLNHLLLNAVKFTPDGGELTLRARRKDDGALVISVIDTGSGIDPQSLPRLFEPFFTSYDVSRHSSGHYEYGRRGLGLGLSVVKAFTELHGGKVTVHSEPGKGSTFTISLPNCG
jgi:signal transduction histidine kinase